MSSKCNGCLDTFGKGGYALINKMSYLLPPALLGGVGAAGSAATGVGYAKGILQGVTSGVMHSWAIKPFFNYLNAHKGEGAGKISPEAVKFLKGAAYVAEVALPIAATYYLADYIVPVMPAMPEFITHLISAGKALEYTVVKGATMAAIIFGSAYAVEHGGEAVKFVTETYRSSAKASVSSSSSQVAVSSSPSSSSLVRDVKNVVDDIADGAKGLLDKVGKKDKKEKKDS